MRVVIVGCLFLLNFALHCNGIPRFANYLQDHMVLQRAPQRAIVWGFGDSGVLTILTMNNQVYETISAVEPVNAQNESIWSVTLEPVSQEGPYDINVSQPLTNGTLVSITLHDVLFGDVWLCSGQSNMQMTVSMIFNATEEISNAGNFPKIRLFTAALNESAIPVEELLGIELPWSIASSKTVGGADWHYMSAVCWLYGRMIHQALDGRPIGLIATSWGGTAIEVWMPPKVFRDCNETSIENVSIQSEKNSLLVAPSNHSCLFNSMIHPFTRMVIYGVIWYQGEANSGSHIYACTFSKMIESWRKLWYERTNGSSDLQFPFGFVQLSTWTNDSSIVQGFPMLRWQQTFNIGYVPNNIIPKVFMAVALDLRDDPNGVHPRYKHDVGYRLSRSGLAVAYGQQVEFQGPIVQKVSYSNGSETINLTYGAVSGIDLRNSAGFEVCCQKYQCSNYTAWTSTTILSKHDLTITVSIPSSCAGQQIFAIRYLWRESPCLFKQAAIYSSTDPNLPSPPFLKFF